MADEIVDGSVAFVAGLLQGLVNGSLGKAHLPQLKDQLQGC